LRGGGRRSSNRACAQMPPLLLLHCRTTAAHATSALFVE
jgi:hypothetical protein